jgi:hypothetical protein
MSTRLYDIIIQDPSFFLSVPTYAASISRRAVQLSTRTAAISEMNSTVSTDSTESTHKVQYDQIPRRDPRRRQLILKTKLDHPSMENWEIAARADCTPDYVRSVLRTNPITSKPIQAAERASLAPSCPEAAAQNPSWFEKAIETDLAGLRAALEREQPRRPSTNLLNTSRVRPITQRELKANTFHYNLNSTDLAEIKRS